MYPECATPNEINKEFIRIWALNIAVQNVQEAARILKHRLDINKGYHSDLQDFRHVLHKYKKLLNATIIDHFKKRELKK